MSNDLKYLRVKKAKGRRYYYFDHGKREDGQRDLRRLPDIKDKRFGDCYARALGERGKATGKRGVLSLDSLIRMYEKSPEFRSKSENTQKSYTLYLGVANKLMRNGKGESWPAKRIERKDIIDLRDALSDRPGAASQCMRVMGALFSWAVDNEKVEKTPVTDIKKFKGKPHEPWPEELLEEALADPQVGMAVALFYFTGQRIGDVIAMKWSDIRDDAMRVYIHKKDKHIWVAILPELQAMLDKQEKTAVTILTNANGKPWKQGGLRPKLQAWAKERGHKVVPHGLRKNAVISLLESGCTAAEVAGITDQSIQMIEHYAAKVNKLHLGRAAVVKLEAHRKARNKA